MASYIVTGIHAAARAGKLQKVQDYIGKGGDVNKPDREHCSPLMWACWGGHVEIVKRLLDEGAKPNTFSHQHATAMHWATWGGHTEIVKLLLEHKVPLDESDEQDGTPLHYAAKKGFVGLAKVLAGAGATIDVRNVKNMTPLHLACHYNKVEVARFLILKQAGVGSVDHINRTPLHYACLKSHINSVRLLLEWGAEVMVIDNKGKLPLHLVGQSASQKNRGKSDDIIKLLKSKMPEDDDEGLDGSYHPESDGTLMGAAMSVAKNVASSSTNSITIPAAAAAAAAKTPSTAAKAAPATAGKAAGGAQGNGTSPATNGGMATATRGVTALQVGADGELSEHPEVTLPGQGKTPVKSEAPAPRKSSFLLNPGGGAGQRQSPERKSVTDRRVPGAGGQAATDRRASGAGGGPSVRGVSPANASDVTLGAVGGQGSPDISLAEKQRARKKSTINIMMSDGVVSIGDGKVGGEASPTSRRRSANLAATNASVAPVAASRVKRSPQGSVAGESSTKGSERDEMEEVSNEEVAYEMALEQIIADLDDLEERVENLNVDQKTNEDILLNVLKRVDETEKDLRKMKRTTIAKEFEAKQANATGAVLDRTLGAEAPLAATLGGVGGATTTDWQGSGISSEQFASKDEVGELRQAVAMKDKELRDIRDRVQDKEAELDTLRKAGKNLRERLDEKEVETRGIMDRESWFANETDGGPSLEDFLATDPSQLPFLQELPEATEDYVRYQLFVDDWDSIEHLQELRESVLRLVDSLTAGFIWHQDPFSLTIAVPPEGDLEPHLQGEQLFGGNVSDEWFVCYLLFAITSSFNGLTACVNDNDGEFLLIEAATAIPPFLSPANSNHRVWIRFSELHLVMPGCMVDRARTPRTLGSGVISLSEGLKAVRESDGWTKADEGVQRLIRCRIEGYPEKATADMHHARCFLPLSAALVFRQSPGLVSAAVRSFCSGDPADKKHGVRMARLFPPPTAVFGTSGARSTDGRPQPATPRVVETRIAFTRYLYAQLHQAAVVPSRAFPPGWGPVGSALSPTPHSKAAHLGQKLSMGLEAAYQASAESCDRSARGDLRSAISPSAWKTFLSVLEQKGFFEGELEGSKRYREKTAMAEQFVRDSVLRVDDSEDKDASAAQRELRRCTVHEVVDRDISDVGGEHVFDSSTEEDDKEDWLEVSQADLDTLLQDYNRSGDGVAGANDGDDDGVAAEETKRSRDSQLGFTTAVDELDDIVTGMNAFVDDSEAGLEGAEVEAVGGNVQFDVNKFMSLLNGEDLMSAIDGAAKEDAHGGLYDSEDDLLESSEEEDDDDDGLEQKTQRMPEPRGGGSARPKGTPTPPSGERSSSLCDTPVRNSGPSDVRSGGKSHIRTKAGVRPTVAFQMQEMEGRPSEDDLNDSSADSGAKKPSVAAGGEGGTGGTTDFMREYMAAMEVELDPSAVGQSFEKVGQTISEAQLEGLQTVGPLDQNGKLAPEEWLRSDSTQPATDAAGDQPAEDIENPAEEYKPVDVDMNLVKHLLESTVSQGGLSGPASNLLRSMGLSFPSIPPGSGAGKSPTKIEDVTPSTGGV